MLSSPEVARLLAHRFVALRMDWPQARHYRGQLGLMLKTGKHILLDPAGRVRRGWLGRARVYGRRRRRLTIDVLARLAAKHPPTSDALRLDWFWWTPRPAGPHGGDFPLPPRTMAALVRLPVAEVQGALPPPLQSSAFLRRHVRQFIWARGPEDGPPRLLIQRAPDGFPAGRPTVLADLDPASLSGDELGRALDAAWLAYMRDRPLSARGYLATPYNRLLRPIGDRLVAEEYATRRRARDGSLVPPGRRAEIPAS